MRTLLNVSIDDVTRLLPPIQTRRFLLERLLSVSIDDVTRLLPLIQTRKLLLDRSTIWMTSDLTQSPDQTSLRLTAVISQAQHERVRTSRRIARGLTKEKSYRQTMKLVVG